MTTIITTTPPTGLRRLVPATIFAAAVAAMILTAQPANALTEDEIKTQCDVTGGTYQTLTKDGNTFSACCYYTADLKPASGNDKNCIFYINGQLSSNEGANQGPGGGPTRPAPPGQLPTQILVPGNPPPVNNPG